MNKQLRIGVYENKLSYAQSEDFIKNICKHNQDTDIVVVGISPKERSPDDEYNQIITALKNREIDVGILEYTKYTRGSDNTNDYANTRVIGADKRQDSRNVLVTERKHGNYIEGARVITDSPLRQKQMENLYEDVICKERYGGITSYIKMVSEHRCDGAVLSAAQLKSRKIHKLRGLSYTFYDTRSFVPLHGQGIVAAVAYDFYRKKSEDEAVDFDNDISDNGEEIFSMLKKATDKLAWQELIIEQNILNKIDKLSMDYYLINKVKLIDTFNICINAQIVGEELNISMFIVTENENFVKIYCNGRLEEKNRLIRQALEKMTEKIYF